MKALIVSGGDKPSKTLLSSVAKDIDIIVGVDKGCQYLYENNIIPNIIIGDFDSSDLNVISFLEQKGSVRHQYKCEKDFTDSESAFSLLLDMGVKSIVFLGATGKRFDHTLGNIGLLLKALNNNVQATIIDGNNLITLVNKSSIIKKIEKYKYISFLAYNCEVEKFCINNAKYKLSNYNLVVGDSRTISNEFLDGDIEITFHKGIIIVIYSMD